MIQMVDNRFVQELVPKQFQGLESLIQEHSASVFRYLRSMTGDEDAAHDVLQDTFLKLGPYGDEAGRALVFTAARSCALDYLRRRQTRNRRETPVEAERLIQFPGRRQDSPEHHLHNKRLRQDLLEALAGLPEDQRTVFHLSEIEGLSYEEISTVLEVRPGTIASRKHHAVLKLRNTLRRCGHGA